MKRETHEAQTRQRITKVARRLFFQQGYNQTGIRQIAEAAAVQIGTIYHFFTNKEGVLQQVAMEAFRRVIERTRRLSEGDNRLEMASEIAWHVYTMVHHRPSAEMYLVTYNSPIIAAEILQSQIERSQTLFASQQPHLSELQHEVAAMFAKGIMQSITLRVIDQSLTQPTFIIRETITNILRLMHVESAHIEHTLERLSALRLEARVLRILERDVVIS
ncbi:MAG: helix-turn-helix domain-containing protein [Bacteroidota bacterium]